MALILILLPVRGFAAASATGAASACLPVKECGLAVDKHLLQDAMNSATAGALKPGTGDSMQTGGNTITSAGTSGATTSCAAKQVCTASKAKCNPANTASKCTPKDCTSLDAFITQMTAACAANTSAVQQAGRVLGATGGIGRNTLMAGLAGAAVGAGVVALAQNGRRNEAVAPVVMPAAVAVGTTAPVAAVALDCAAAESRTNPDCFEDLRAKCIANPALPECADFKALYCNPATAKNGIGTGFCTYHAADQFCRTAGRESCLSCQPAAAANRTNPTCVNDPNLCRPQFSQTQIAQGRTSCPSDPAFADPTFGQAPVTGTTIVMLPASTASQPQIGGQYGPNLFSVTSQAIQARCRAGRLNNCR